MRIYTSISSSRFSTRIAEPLLSLRERLETVPIMSSLLQAKGFFLKLTICDHIKEISYERNYVCGIILFQNRQDNDQL